ncbi:hypothetical protein [Streptomyces qinglanensis]|uniref:hypothetical protein n=1 Tax=Streptomyces qinglanensis TaxID=943816 RepID=UPI003D738D58
MSAQPIEQPPITYFSTERNRRAVETTIDTLSLPYIAVTARPAAVHVIASSIRDLCVWTFQLGGRIDQGVTAADGESAMYTLHTGTPARADGSSVAVQVHAISVAGDEPLSGGAERV